MLGKKRIGGRAPLFRRNGQLPSDHTPIAATAREEVRERLLEAYGQGVVAPGQGGDGRTMVWLAARAVEAAAEAGALTKASIATATTITPSTAGRRTARTRRYADQTPHDRMGMSIVLFSFVASVRDQLGVYQTPRVTSASSSAWSSWVTLGDSMVTFA